jgi:hypothetical protein
MTLLVKYAVTERQLLAELSQCHEEYHLAHLKNTRNFTTVRVHELAVLLRVRAIYGGLHDLDASDGGCYLFGLVAAIYRMPGARHGAASVYPAMSRIDQRPAPPGARYWVFVDVALSCRTCAAWNSARAQVCPSARIRFLESVEPLHIVKSYRAVEDALV